MPKLLTTHFAFRRLRCSSKCIYVAIFASIAGSSILSKITLLQRVSAQEAALEVRSGCRVQNGNACLKLDESNGWLQFCPFFGADRVDPSDGTDSGCVAIKAYRAVETNLRTGTETTIDDAGSSLTLLSDGDPKSFRFNKKCAAGPSSSTGLIPCVPADVEQDDLLGFILPLRLELYATGTTVNVRAFLFTNSGTISYAGKKMAVAKNSFMFDIYCERYLFLDTSDSAVPSIEFMVRTRGTATRAATLTSYYGIDDAAAQSVGIGGNTPSTMTWVNNGLVTLPSRGTFVPIDAEGLATTRPPTTSAPLTTQAVTTSRPPSTTSRPATTTLFPPTTPTPSPTTPKPTLRPTVTPKPTALGTTTTTTTTTTAAASPTTTTQQSSSPQSSPATSSTAIPEETTTRNNSSTTTAQPLTTTGSPSNSSSTALATTTAAATSSAIPSSPTAQTNVTTAMTSSTHASTTKVLTTTTTTLAAVTTTRIVVPSSSTTTVPSGIPTVTTASAATTSLTSLSSSPTSPPPASTTTIVTTTPSPIPSTTMQSTTTTTPTTTTPTTTTPTTTTPTTTTAATTTAMVTESDTSTTLTTTMPADSDTTVETTEDSPSPRNIPTRRRLLQQQDSAGVVSSYTPDGRFIYMHTAYNSGAPIPDAVTGGGPVVWAPVGVRAIDRTQQTRVISIAFNTRAYAFHYAGFVEAPLYDSVNEKIFKNSCDNERSFRVFSASVALAFGVWQVLVLFVAA